MVKICIPALCCRAFPHVSEVLNSAQNLARDLGGGIKALLRRPALPVLTARPNEAAGVVHLMPPRGRKKGPAAAAVKTRYRPLAAKGGVVFHAHGSSLRLSA